MTSSEERAYDVIIYGASGFVGQYVVDELANTIEDEGLRWALGGRSMSRLIQTLRNACDRTGKDLSKVNVVRGDLTNQQALLNVTAQTKLLINCVGPYRLYGDTIVQACIDQGTHYLDLSGEPGFLDNLHLKYDGLAKTQGSYVVGSCGWDSIPADLGVVYLRKQFAGELAWVESFLKINKGKRGPLVNFATFQSGIYSARLHSSDVKLHEEVMGKSLLRPSHLMPSRSPVFYSGAMKQWCMALPSSLQTVIECTQKQSQQIRKQRPVQFRSYLCPSSIFQMIFYMITGAIFGVLSMFNFGCRMLEKYPRFLSGGIAKKGGPKPDQVASRSFTMKLVGKGWPEKIANLDEQHKDAPSTSVVANVEGPELAYLSASICIVQAAYALLKETKALPSEGGVFTPGTAFANTTLIDRLNLRGIKFSILKN